MPEPTTFLAISDVHGDFEAFEPGDLPDADAVLVAGDMTNWGMRGRETVLCAKWLRRLADRYRAVFWIPGNHDIGVRADRFDGVAPNLVCLLDNIVDWEGWKLHGVALTPCYDMPELANQWDYMTADPHQEVAAFDFEPVDILVSHGPPHGILDSAGRALARLPDGSVLWQDVHIGSRALADYIDRNQPYLVVCGHAHNNPIAPVQRGRTRIYNVAERYELIRVVPDGERGTSPQISQITQI